MSCHCYLTLNPYDEYFKTFYARLKAKGKHTTQAQIAVMRKMILIAHSLYKNKRDYVRNFSNQEEIKMG
jgi:phosphotransacetylase